MPRERLWFSCRAGKIGVQMVLFPGIAGKVRVHGLGSMVEWCSKEGFQHEPEAQARDSGTGDKKMNRGRWFGAVLALGLGAVFAGQAAADRTASVRTGGQRSNGARPDI